LFILKNVFSQNFLISNNDTLFDPEGGINNNICFILNIFQETFGGVTKKLASFVRTFRIFFKKKACTMKIETFVFKKLWLKLGAHLQYSNDNDDGIGGGSAVGRALSDDVKLLSSLGFALSLSYFALLLCLSPAKFVFEIFAGSNHLTPIV
jgi:hypothetical protein